MSHVNAQLRRGLSAGIQTMAVDVIAAIVSLSAGGVVPKTGTDLRCQCPVSGPWRHDSS
jgi:hypothetical protein